MIGLGTGIGGAGRRIGNAWMITFVDLMALCLAFFVMLHAMTAPKPGIAGAAAGLGATDTLERAEALIRTALVGEPAFADGRLARRDDRLVLSLAAEALFAADGSLAADGQRLAARLATALAGTGNRIDVIARPSGDEAQRRPVAAWRLSLAEARGLAEALGPQVAALAAADGAARRRVDIVLYEEPLPAPQARN